MPPLVITKRTPENFHADDPSVPTGYSYQTNRIERSWAEMEDHIKRREESLGGEAVFEREDDYRKLRTTRYFHCCNKVQRQGVDCHGCGHPVGC